MIHSVVRLDSISIENFKNVNSGQIDLVNKKSTTKCSLLGLYGQNGSGKTALIDAMALLKQIICMESVNYKFADYINVNCECANLSYRFSVTEESLNRIYHINYSFSLKKVDNSVPSQNINNGVATPPYKVQIFNEVLSFDLYENNVQIKRLQPLIDTTNESAAFGPKNKYLALVGKGKDTATNMLVIKKVSATMSQSFIFCNEFINIIKDSCQEPEYLNLIDRLIQYGLLELFVFDTKSNAIISFNALPLSFNIWNKDKGAAGNIVIPIDGNGVIPDGAYSVVKTVVSNMNIVLNQLVPGLTIDINELGTELLPDGSKGKRIQLLSLKNEKTIPLCYESEGIKKIVAILQLLIVVYNRRSITVAIDELDAGIFEYLLGEILHIIAEKGKGQLIFTSHNLRPLETLDKAFVAFTTTNPSHRYVRLTNVKTTNNLRDFYYRDIVLGEQAEQVYESTNNHKIALAFKEAGEGCVS